MSATEIDQQVQTFLSLPNGETRLAWLAARQEHSTTDFVVLAQALKNRVTELMRDEPDQAKHIALLLTDMAAYLDEPQIQAIADWAWANAYIFQGRHADCLARYQKALQYYLSIDDQQNIAELRSNCAVIYTNVGDYKQAITEFEAIRTLLRDTAAAINLAINLAWLYHQLDRFTDVIAAVQEGKAIAERLNLPVYAARLDINLALALEELGQFDEAIQSLLSAESFLAANDERLDRARARLDLGMMRFRLGEYRQALQDMDQARRDFTDMDNPMEVAIVDGHQAQIYLQLSLLPETIDLCEKSRVTLFKHELKRDGAITDYYAGVAYGRLGEHELSQQYLTRASQVLGELALPVQQAIVDLAHANQTVSQLSTIIEIATAANSTTTPTQDELQAAETTVQTALDLFEDRQLSLHQAEALVVLGHVQREMMSDIDSAPEYGAKARQNYQEALILLADQSYSTLFGAIYYGLGQLAQQQGDLEQALDWYDRAVQKIETTLFALGDGELRAGFLYDKLGLFQAAIALHLQMGNDGGNHDRALSLMELARPIGWQGEPPAGVETAEETISALATEVAQLRQQWQWHYTKLYSAKLSADMDPEMEPEMEPEIDPDHGQAETVRGPLADTLFRQRRQAMKQCEDALTRAVRNLRLHYQRHTHLDASRITVARVCQRLAPQQCLLLFYTTREQCTLFMITHGQMQTVTLPTPWPEIRERLSQMHFEMAWGSEAVQEHLEWLWQALLAHVAPQLAGYSELIIIPHGALYHLPFHGLHDGQRYLSEMFQIQYAPTLTWFMQAGRRRPDIRGESMELSGLIMACSQQGSLPGVLDEARTIHRFWSTTECSGSRNQTWGHLDVQLCLEDDATGAHLRQQAAHCRLLHIAAHGEFRQDNPLFSALYLGDGPLLLADLDQLHFQAAPLVILSACETGRGTDQGANILGLCQAFLRAGASTLLVTLWRIPDRATTQLMQFFYEQLMAGSSTAQALRQAQLQLASQPEFAHPLNWAGWILIEG